MNEETVKRLALTIVANCMKDSVIEACHQQRQISDSELTAFNQQLSDRIYTFLSYLLTKPTNEYAVMMAAMLKNFPESWDLPTLDQKLANAVQKLEDTTTPPA